MKIKIKDIYSVRKDELLSTLINTVWYAERFDDDSYVINAFGGLLVEKNECDIIE